MTQPVATHLREFWKALQANRRYWIPTTAAAFVLALAYICLVPRQWKTSQALVIRTDTVAESTRQARSDNAMQLAQETIVEISKNPTVLAAALTEAGPPAKCKNPDAWPDERDIESLQKAISVTAPKGTEFGKTEVIYLAVKAPSRDRSLALTNAVCDELEARFKRLRDTQAGGLIAELTKSVGLAREELDSATRQLAELERQVGSDLTELRALSDNSNVNGNLRQTLDQIHGELRKVRSTLQDLAQQKKMLQELKADPRRLAEASNQIFDMHPSLRRLKDGLVDAQLRTAQLLGKMNEGHPEVIAALAAQNEVKQNLSHELETVLRGIDADEKLNRTRLATLNNQADEVSHRLERLVSIRTEYSNLTTEYRNCSETLVRAQKDLADARAAQAAAQSVSPITRMDAPDPGVGPVGPGPLTVLVGATLGGFAIGSGLVLVFVPIGNQKRRWSDYLGIGRRASDNSGHAPPSAGTAAAGVGKRATDIAAASMPAATPAATGAQVERRGSGSVTALPASNAAQPRQELAPAISASQVTPASQAPSQPASPTSQPAATASVDDDDDNGDRRQGRGRRKTDQRDSKRPAPPASGNVVLPPAMPTIPTTGEMSRN